MIKSFVLIVYFLINGVIQIKAQRLAASYKGILYREDKKEVVFDMHTVVEKGQTVLYIKNAAEKIRIVPSLLNKDSLNFSMPVFESEFKTVIQKDGSLKGVWFKGTSGITQQWPFTAFPGKKRFDLSQGNAKDNISGKWFVTITRANGTKRFAVAEFFQNGNNLTGTFLTPSGDYRYLQGIVTGNMMMLSTFDGAHAYIFSAKIQDGETMAEGFFGSGIAGVETWEAVKNANAQLPVSNAPELKDGFTSLDFSFRDVDSNTISILDDRYKNKVVILQAMGSWCPNCMDETKFLSDYYNKNKTRGVEVIALAYEYSTDFERSQKSLRKFQKLFDVKYPMLITGAAVSDTLKTQKTLPQLTEIKVFPTTIFINRKGEVHSVHPGYYGPGSGKYHEEFKKEFYQTVEALLKE